MKFLKAFSEIMKKEKLSHSLAVAGGIVFIFSSFLLFVSILVLSVPNVSFNPPSSVNRLIESGYGFLLNRWFWSTVLFASILGLIFGTWAHPETQLTRKLRAKAVAEYKKHNEWPWL